LLLLFSFLFLFLFLIILFTLQTAARQKQVQKLTGWTILSDIPVSENCPVCLSLLKHDSSSTATVVKLSRCVGHFFHQDCIVHCGAESFVQCPICSEIYGTRTGTMPKGTMSVSVLKDSHCSGFEKVAAIQILYSFPDGTQSAEHPSPGEC
jgi:hypothetical protein